MGLAHSYIDAAASAGADAIKFQTHIASAESTYAEPWRIKFSFQDASRFDYWKRMEFSRDQWKELKDHAAEKKLDFICSPFSNEAVDLMQEAGVDAWKIASGEVNDFPLFKKIAMTGLPVFLSTGMSSISEIDQAVDYLKGEGCSDITIMQCTSMYPTPAEKLGLNMMNVLRERYGCKTGLSDHSGNIYSGLAAAALGADSLEVHLTFSREMFGPDIPVSITVEELSMLVQGSRFIKRAIDTPVDKDKLAEELKEMKTLFNKSIVAKTDIVKGTTIVESMLAFKKPGTGLSPDNLNAVLGKKALRDIKYDEIIKNSDFE